MQLHIGVDAEKVVVSPHPLKMASGRGRRRRQGSVIELVPAEPSGRSREQRIKRTAQLAMPLLLLGAVLDALGIAWWISAIGGLGLLGFAVRQQARAARPGIIATPGGDHGLVLVAAQERAAYERALVVSRRIRRTWPELGGLVDPAEADRALTRALDELAALMARRQQIRRLRAELTAVRPGDLPPDSPAVRALAAQRNRVEHLWRTTGAQANRMLASIDAAALAGESLIREQRIQDTAHRAELALARLATGGPDPEIEAGPALAERTAAVIAAYRELREL
jgi:hypothetical protein